MNWKMLPEIFHSPPSIFTTTVSRNSNTSHKNQTFVKYKNTKRAYLIPNNKIVGRGSVVVRAGDCRSSGSNPSGAVLKQSFMRITPCGNALHLSYSVAYPELVSRGVSKSRKFKWLVKVGAPIRVSPPD